MNWVSQYLEIFPYTVLGFTVFLLLIGVINFFAIKRFDEYPTAKESPRVSILVPARNEAEKIETCVKSLLAQNYSDFEVLVLDDHSKDETYLILVRLAEQDPRLRVLAGKPLPGGWLGKHWACHQLARAATGDLLLFTDADTRHAPNMLRDSVSAFLAEGADMLTIFPREETVTWGEKFIIPAIGFFIFSFLPLALVQKLRLPALAVAIGQFMMFRRGSLEAVGGFESVRANTMDDVSLARQIIRHGYHWRIMDGTQHVTCRMYNGFWETVDGFTKNIFAYFDYHLLLSAFAWTWIWLAYVLPPLVLLADAFGMPVEFFPYRIAVFSTALALLSWAISFRRFRFPMALLVIYPVTLTLFVLIAYRSMAYNLTGQANWKDRTLAPPLWRW
ncbi:MAG: glycosyltransferase family 2 protein [Chloroflexota bacterium]